MGIEVEPKVLFGHVMHGRLFPKKNAFKYAMTYLHIPLDALKTMPLAYNKFRALSFYDRDHGACDGSDLDTWARDVLAQYNIDTTDFTLTLVCMPRVLGYVFNPVSFFLCHDKDGHLRAVLCEVHNTFGERHTYLCAHPDQSAILPQDTLKAEKLFHVSPFLEREGHYIFRFDARDKTFSVWIDYYHENGQKQLVTSLIGDLKPMNKKTLKAMFWRYPLITMKATVLIHVQALKLVVKKIRYISKPKQKKQRLSATENITKY